jgi:hypothetical protein
MLSPPSEMMSALFLIMIQHRGDGKILGNMLSPPSEMMSALFLIMIQHHGDGKILGNMLSPPSEMMSALFLIMIQHDVITVWTTSLSLPAQALPQHVSSHSRCVLGKQIPTLYTSMGIFTRVTLKVKTILL